METIKYTTTKQLPLMNRNEERLRFLREEMFPVFEWFEVMKKEELDEYCQLVSGWGKSSRRIWKKMLQIYYQIYLREKLYGVKEQRYKQ